GAACNVGMGGSLAATGSAEGCVSDVGAFDMAGNLAEWVAEWVPRSVCVQGSWGNFSTDFQCLLGAATFGPPGAIVRGGCFDCDPGGVYYVSGSILPTESAGVFGFRGARRSLAWPQLRGGRSTRGEGGRKRR